MYHITYQGKSQIRCRNYNTILKIFDRLQFPCKLMDDKNYRLKTNNKPFKFIGISSDEQIINCKVME
jgi:hypothetical protein